MRVVRTEMRARRTPDLTVPQFRALAFVRRHRGASLSEAADHIGLTPPSMSKLMDGLVARGLVTREGHARDRRRVTLALTRRGRGTLRAASAATRAQLAARLAALPSAERATVAAAMRALRAVFAPDPAGGGAASE